MYLLSASWPLVETTVTLEGKNTADMATEGKEAFLEKRKPDWSSYPWHF
jgi:1,4-dihydroxy-2-naphthoyl-CoA synthase